MAEGEQPRARQRTRSRTETIEESLLKNATWMTASYELADASALKALAVGQANPEQQIRALMWIMQTACLARDWAYRPGANDGDTNIGLGRQFVAHQIQHLISLPIGAMRRNEPRADPHDPTT